MTIHVYDRPRQPATRWVYEVAGRRFVHRTPANERLTTFCCRRRRRARYCQVKVFYDGIYVYCRQGRGCTVAPHGRMRPCPFHGRCRGCSIWKVSR